MNLIAIIANCQNRLTCFMFLLNTTACIGQNIPNCGNVTNADSTINRMEPTKKNVLCTDLQFSSIDPLTGFFRIGYCNTDANDRGLHVVAAVVTDEFLQYSFAKGNDLISGYPPSGFPCLKAGNVWCLCALRWKEALVAGVAPPIILDATNIKALDYLSMEDLQNHAVK